MVALHERAAPEVIRTCSGELVPRRGRARCRDSLSFPTVMGWPTTGSCDAGKQNVLCCLH